MWFYPPVIKMSWQRRSDVLLYVQWRRRYVSNETSTDVSMERRQDVSVVRLHDVLLERHNDVSKGRNKDATPLRRHNVSNKPQMKHPTSSRWNVAKTSQWCISTTSYWNVITTSQKDVTATPHHYVSTTSQTSLKWNTQRRLSGTYPRRPISTSLQRLLWVPNKTPKNVVVVCLHHVSELRFRDLLLVGLYYSFKSFCCNLHLVGF